MIRMLIAIWTLMALLRNATISIADVGDIISDIGFTDLAALEPSDVAAIADTDKDIGAVAVIIAQDHVDTGARIADTGNYHAW